jgi:hypothetical protein
MSSGRSWPREKRDSLRRPPSLCSASRIAVALATGARHLSSLPISDLARPSQVGMGGRRSHCWGVTLRTGASNPERTISATVRSEIGSNRRLTARGRGGLRKFKLLTHDDTREALRLSELWGSPPSTWLSSPWLCHRGDGGIPCARASCRPIASAIRRMRGSMGSPPDNPLSLAGHGPFRSSFLGHADASMTGSLGATAVIAHAVLDPCEPQAARTAYYALTRSRRLAAAPAERLPKQQSIEFPT